MSKKKSKKQTVLDETPKTFSKEEIDAGLQICHQEYFLQVVGLASHDKSLEELTYIKVPIGTPDGGIYLVSILHVEGPKINLRKLAELSDQLEAENKKPLP